MKALGNFITFILVIALIFYIFGCDSLSTVGKDIETKFKVGDIVYILPDSTKAIIENGIIITDTKKINDIRIKTIYYQSYHVIYKDNNGVIHRMKYIEKELLTK